VPTTSVGESFNKQSSQKALNLPGCNSTSITYFMFSTTFDRPVGAAADVKELEYITALHQTCDEDEDAFLDGSIEG
jgi:hypothetical protein